jgi:hypothetical protein
MALVAGLTPMFTLVGTESTCVWSPEAEAPVRPVTDP